MVFMVQQYLCLIVIPTIITIVPALTAIMNVNWRRGRLIAAEISYPVAMTSVRSVLYRLGSKLQVEALVRKIRRTWNVAKPSRMCVIQSGRKRRGAMAPSIKLTIC